MFFAITLALFIFFIDITIPLGVAVGALYPACYFTSLDASFNKLLAITVFCCALIIIGFFMSGESDPPALMWQVVANRLIALFLVLAFGRVCYKNYLSKQIECRVRTCAERETDG